MSALRWEIFCRVVDNFGDVGVCWRLAAQLAARGDRVRLVIDDASALAWMAPEGAPGVEVVGWAEAEAPSAEAMSTEAADIDVVIEAFGCDPPAPHVAAMARAALPPVWINLEYLSAEAYVERSHGLASPRADGLVTWFYFPGFTPRTGGLLREDGLMAARTAFDRDAWLATLGLARRAGERVVSLFCYPEARVPELLANLGRAPTLLLLTPGAAQDAFARATAARPPPPTLRTHALPWLDQPGFDHLLWSADLNFVRGEDSLVRAVWAGAPFVWMAYPQADDAHRAKLEALLARADLPAPAAAAQRAWNGFAPWAPLPTPDAGGAWHAAVQAWRAALLEAPDLAQGLRRFALAKRAPTPAP